MFDAILPPALLLVSVIALVAQFKVRHLKQQLSDERAERARLQELLAGR